MFLADVACVAENSSESFVSPKPSLFSIAHARRCQNYLQEKVRTSGENQVRVEQTVKVSLSHADMFLKAEKEVQNKSIFCVAIIDAEILGEHVVLLPMCKLRRLFRL